MKKLILILVCIAALSACKKTATYTPDCSGTAKSFATDVMPLMSSNCVSCHSNFSSYAGVSGDKSAIRSNIVSGNMPKSTTLSQAQKDAVVCWIDNGAANN